VIISTGFSETYRVNDEVIINFDSEFWKQVNY
jgi:hypothetical protein